MDRQDSLIVGNLPFSITQCFQNILVFLKKSTDNHSMSHYELLLFFTVATTRSRNGDLSGFNYVFLLTLVFELVYIYIYIKGNICLSAHLSVCLPIHLSVCLYHLSVPSVCTICLYHLSVPSVCTICLYHLSVPSVCTICLYHLSVPSLWPNLWINFSEIWHDHRF